MTGLQLTKRGKRVKDAFIFAGGVALTWGVIFGAAVLEKVVS